MTQPEEMSSLFSPIFIKDRLEEFEYEYKILGKSICPSQGCRVIILVKLKNPYISLIGDKKYWIPFYISSGSNEGSVKNRAQPYFGFISTYSQCFISATKYNYYKKNKIKSHPIVKNTSTDYNIYHDSLKMCVVNKVHEKSNFFELLNEPNLEMWKLSQFPTSEFGTGNQLAFAMYHLIKDLDISKEKINKICNRLCGRIWMIKCSIGWDDNFGIFPKAILMKNTDKNILLRERIKNLKENFPEELTDTKICNNEFNNISIFLTKELTSIDRTKIPTLTNSEIEFKIGDNNPFGITLTHDICNDRSKSTVKEINDFLDEYSSHITNVPESPALDMSRELLESVTEEDIYNYLINNIH